MKRILLVAFVLTMFGTIFGIRLSDSRLKATLPANLPQFTRQQLQAFDGTDPNKPIYLALDGLVYDVTPGKEFYQTGGAYHDLAGKDSSGPLNLVGGSIIKRKYQVIGTFKQ